MQVFYRTEERRIWTEGKQFKYNAFLTLLLEQVSDGENLFISGRIVGKNIWNKRREPLIRLGASFQIEPGLVLSNEITPIFEQIGKIERLRTDDNTIIIKNTLSPQFIIGTAQGILDAIHEYMNKKVNISVEYVMSGKTVFLSLRDVKF